MSDQDLTEASRLYARTWVWLGLLFALLLVLLRVSDFSIVVDSLLVQAFCTASIFVVIAYCGMRWRFATRVAMTLGAIVQISVLFSLASPLTYIAASLNLPLQDANLAHLDHMLGLDWRAYFEFIYNRPALIPYAYLGYAMILWPMVGVPLVIGSLGQFLRLQQFAVACILTVAVVGLLSTFVPAIGTYFQYGISPDPEVLKPSGYQTQLDQLPKIRDGSLRVLHMPELAGIITFPSFHAAAAVLVLWVLWSVWWLRPFTLITNLGMLLATPLIGGHYFVDVFAGILVAVGAVLLAKAMSREQIRLSHLAPGLAPLKG